MMPIMPSTKRMPRAIHLIFMTLVRYCYGVTNSVRPSTNQALTRSVASCFRLHGDEDALTADASTVRRNTWSGSLVGESVALVVLEPRPTGCCLVIVRQTLDH